MKKIRLAIVGCGIVAREHHIPALKKLKDKYEIVALNSRTRESAERLSGMLENNPRIKVMMNCFPGIPLMQLILRCRQSTM